MTKYFWTFGRPKLTDNVNYFWVFGRPNIIYDNTYVPPPVTYPIALLRKHLISGYHCFLNQYIRATIEGYTPLKLPDGTVF